MTVDLALIKSKLYTAVLSDALDGFGLTHQAMRPFVRPLDDDTVLFGRARTGVYAVAYGVGSNENPYDVEIALVDDLNPGDVAVLACDGPTERITPWGGLLSAAAAHRKAAGCVTDGLVRDVRKIRNMGFAVFSGAIGPLDSRGRGKMVAKDVTIECAGVRVEPGDFVFGDVDGVVVVPQGRAAEIFEAALNKVKGEEQTCAELATGVKLAEVYARYGIL